MIKKFFLTLIVINSILLPALPDEGMWIPLLIEKFNINDMQAKGFHLSAEDIYSINQACLVNAVILFGGNCTGEVISPEGLLLTNYHCGLGRIQYHSSVEKDYLTDGFWAYSKDQELPNPGLTASFLKRIEDVTRDVNKGIETTMNQSVKKSIRNNNIQNIISQATAGTNYNAEIKSFYFGNSYYLFVYETYKDIRLVGAPPSSIGKFGGDTDNWEWPRHTGDFSLFRIYADSLNRPAEYSLSNIPYKPKKYLPVSIHGIKKGDFTMVLGYPAHTDEYLVSDELKLLSDKSLPKKIMIRETNMRIINKAMQNDAAIRIKYISKYNSLSNAWKKWLGVLQGFKKVGVIEKKLQQEIRFQQWLNENKEYKDRFGSLLDEFHRTYQILEPYYLATDIGSEAVMGTELMSFVSKFLVLMNKSDDPAELGKILNNLKNHTTSFFKDYSIDIDREIFTEMMKLYANNVDVEFHPAFFNTIVRKYKGDYQKYANYVYKTSIFTDQQKTLDFVNNFKENSIRTLLNDPALMTFIGFSEIFGLKVYPAYNTLNNHLDSLYQVYMNALMLMSPDKLFYPDANFTMRMTYGKVEGYSPADAVDYRYYTTLTGVMEKENPEVYDYSVPEKLKDLCRTKDFGEYGQNGIMPVCFTASNHTSGGNSGSPVLNADGYLVGLNFDRNWEGTINDYYYDSSVCRNISLDIRYVLFIIDKYAHADNIIRELTIIE